MNDTTCELCEKKMELIETKDYPSGSIYRKKKIYQCRYCHSKATVNE